MIARALHVAASGSPATGYGNQRVIAGRIGSSSRADMQQFDKDFKSYTIPYLESYII